MAELNLIPYELKKRRGKGLDTQTLLIAAIAAVVVIGGAVAYPLVSYGLLQKREKALQTEIQQNQAVLKESDKLTQTINGYKQYMKTVESITKLNPKINDRVRGLEKYTVSDIKFNTLSLVEGVITVGATAGSVDSIAAFTANLQEAADYKDARVSGYTFNKDKSNYTFSITINY